MLFCVRFHYEHDDEVVHIQLCAESEEELYKELSARYPGVSDLDISPYQALKRSVLKDV